MYMAVVVVYYFHIVKEVWAYVSYCIHEAFSLNGMLVVHMSVE